MFAVAVIVSFSIVAWISDKVKFGYGKNLQDWLHIRINPKLGWFLFEVPNLIWGSYYLFSGQITFDSQLLPILLFTIHYINRDIIYPLRLGSKTKQVPIEMVFSAGLFTACNGYLQYSSHLQHVDHTYYDYIRAIVGIIIFFYGMYCNISCDNILRKLRQKEGYSIPYGNLFEYVSSGHYLGEIIEWFGFWLVSGQWSAFLFFISTLSILSARAVQTHKWYKEKFKNYPNRFAIIPLVL